MKRTSTPLLLVFLTLTLFLVACGVSDSPLKVEPASVSSLRLPDFSSWSAEAVCKVLSTDTVAEVLGRDLKSKPQPFDDPAYLGKGCAYDAGKGGANAYFAYIALAPSPLYEDNRRAGFAVREVNDFGLEAFHANGADAEQLWIKLSDEYALVVAIGDEPNPEGARLIAKTFLENVGGDQ